MTTVNLGALEGDSVRPLFRGSAGEVAITVELDSSALIKLTDGHVGQGRIAALEAQRGRVRAAAQALVDNGFLNRAVERPSLIISALDLE